jgi:hypothetical protein
MKRWGESTLPNFDARTSALKNKALLQTQKKKKKCFIKTAGEVSVREQNKNKK